MSYERGMEPQRCVIPLFAFRISHSVFEKIPHSAWDSYLRTLVPSYAVDA